VNVALAAALAAPGLAVGSFLNVVVARLPLRRPLSKPRSACMSCGSELRWYDNLPLVSYAILRGRCRACGAGIPMRYPIVEAVTAALVVACGLRFGLTADALVAAFFCAVLVVVSAIDIERRIIPNRIVLPATVVVLVSQTLLHPSVEWLLASLAAALFLFLPVLVYPAAMGMGDVKLALLLGAMLGRDVAVGMMLGLLAGMIPAVILFARHGRAARKATIPFGPFLAVGGVAALFVGSELLDWYVGSLAALSG
jgi:leader peptidase (prepilin peptidase)/N-methyltransferase